MIDLLFFSLIAFTCFFQGYYILNAFFVDVNEERLKSLYSPKIEKISILIPLYNSSKTIGNCLDAVLQNNLLFIANVIVVLDHCTDNSGEIATSYLKKFRDKNTELKIIPLPKSKFGKVAGILEGGKHIASQTVLLLDADIILDKTAIEELVIFHGEQGNTYSSCLIYPYQDAGKTSIAKHLICNNRLYRQSILQTVKNRYGVSNFPGGVQLVNFEKYRELLEEGFLEDLVATYHVLGSGGRIAILSKVLAYEVERQTILGLLLQRIRWTIGAIENIPAQMRAARARKGLNQKILIYSYHVMWEMQHYVITLAMLMALLRWDYSFYFLIPMAMYAVQIGQSAYLGRKNYRNSMFGIVFHCIFYPIILTIAFVCALALLVKNRSFFFKNQILFRRD